jgi:large repetitive protein
VRLLRLIVATAVFAGVLASSAAAGGYTDASYLTPVGKVGQPYSHRVEWKPGTGCPPYSYAVVGGEFPPGLNLSSDGYITGIPTRDGTYSAYIRQTDQCGPEGEGNSPFRFTIEPSTTAPPAAPLAVTTAALPTGVANVAYSTTLAASGGGSAAKSWSLSGGQIPPGLSLSADGRISGTPAAPGTFTFSVTVSSGSSSASKNLSITITPGLTVNASPQLPTIEVRVPFKASLATVLGTTGGTPPYRYAPVSGFPFGIGLDPTAATIFGSARQPGTLSLTILVLDANQASKQVALTLVVVPRLTIVTTKLQRGRVGKSYRTRIAVTGGQTPAWTISSGSLPAGLEIDPATGVLAGIPLRSGTFRFSVSVRDALGAAVSIRYTLRVGALARRA